ncbi:MAG: hypothetical protein WAL77_14540 [Candidatus Dormiibacterota bacterium]
MSLDLHRQSEQLAGEGDLLLAHGQITEARARYLGAANAEAQAFASISADRPRTRGIIATSAIALFLKADAPETGLRLAHRLLAMEVELPAFAIRDIEDLVDDLRLARDFSARGQSVAPGAYECVLEGPHVGHGLAPADAVVQKVEQVSRFGTRVYEYLSRLPLRRGAVEAHLRAQFGLLMAEPTAGSFRFQVRFSTQPQQLDLSGAPTPVGDVTGLFGSILEAAVQPEADALTEIVPDEGYRLVFLKLVRNLAPAGPAIDRIEVRPLGPVGASTILTRQTARTIGRYITKTSAIQQERERTIEGYLRAIHLNENWIGVGPKEGKLEKLGASHDLVEDTLSGLIDKPVLVTMRRERRSWVVADVTETREADEDGTVEPQG